MQYVIEPVVDWVLFDVSDSPKLEKHSYSIYHRIFDPQQQQQTASSIETFTEAAAAFVPSSLSTVITGIVNNNITIVPRLQLELANTASLTKTNPIYYVFDVVKINNQTEICEIGHYNSDLFFRSNDYALCGFFLISCGLVCAVIRYHNELALAFGYLLVAPLALILGVIELFKPAWENLHNTVESVWRMSFGIRRVVVPRPKKDDNHQEGENAVKRDLRTTVTERLEFDMEVHPG